jgi:hypothetical protein
MEGTDGSLGQNRGRDGLGPGALARRAGRDTDQWAHLV